MCKILARNIENTCRSELIFHEPYRCSRFVWYYFNVKCLWLRHSRKNTADLVICLIRNSTRKVTKYVWIKYLQKGYRFKRPREIFKSSTYPEIIGILLIYISKYESIKKDNELEMSNFCQIFRVPIKSEHCRFNSLYKNVGNCQDRD